MNGKVLKVVEYNLEFGKQARMVNVFGVFRYLPNNNLYIIYRDVLQDYNYVSLVVPMLREILFYL